MATSVPIAAQQSSTDTDSAIMLTPLTPHKQFNRSPDALTQVPTTLKRHHSDVTDYQKGMIND